MDKTLEERITKLKDLKKKVDNKPGFNASFFGWRLDWHDYGEYLRYSALDIIEELEQKLKRWCPDCGFERRERGCCQCPDDGEL